MIGQTLGHYRIEAKLGEGGMGVVYRARDMLLEPVAVKVLAERFQSDANARSRLLAEARAASALNHPNICTVHEVGEADGRAFIVMEYVEGRPLNQLVQSSDQGLPVEGIIRYGSQIAAALAHAHDRGVVHRDLKGGNIIVTGDGRPKVLDFGLAKRLRELAAQETRSAESLEEAGTLVGTLAYMAPEVLKGEPADARSDLWAFGVVLYEMTAGVPPFRGQSGFELTSAILRESPLPLPARTLSGLSGIIQRCLAKEPGQRYQRAGEAQAALEAIQAGPALPVARPARRFAASAGGGPGPWPRQPFWSRRWGCCSASASAGSRNPRVSAPAAFPPPTARPTTTSSDPGSSTTRGTTLHGPGR